jgi:hypothetical protein
VSLSDEHPKPNLGSRVHERVLTLGAGDRCRRSSTTCLLLAMMVALACAWTLRAAGEIRAASLPDYNDPAEAYGRNLDHQFARSSN